MRGPNVTVTIPASADDVIAELTGLGKLITAKKWERAALVASVVRLDLGHGGRDETGKFPRFESARGFAERGIVGLLDHKSVAKYVQAWLDTHDGRYPKLGATVTLPTSDFPPTRTGTDGDRTPAGVRTRVRSIIEQHGTAALAEAVVAEAPNVAAEIVSNVTESLPFGGEIPSVPGDRDPIDPAVALIDLCVQIESRLAVLAVKLTDVEVTPALSLALASAHERAAVVLGPYVSAEAADDVLREWAGA